MIEKLESDLEWMSDGIVDALDFGEGEEGEQMM